MTLKSTLIVLSAAAAAVTAAASAQPPRGDRPEPPRTREEAIERALERFARADQNGDGFISEDEIGEGRRAKMAKRFLARQDTNEDGFVSEAEVEEHAGAMFDELDLDGNGELSDEEMEAAKERGRNRMQDRRG